MADHDSIVSSDKLSAIADAIRDKTGKNGLLTLDQMPDEIESISGGGGGDTPDCGIVPTSWSSIGMVESIDVYGDVLPFACYTSESWDFDRSNYAPDDIEVVTDWVDDTGDIPQYLFLNHANFYNTVNIGKKAFGNIYWMKVTALPDTLEVIGDFAFESCNNFIATTFPASIKSIGQCAFSSCWHPDNGVNDYSSESTYAIGDLAIRHEGDDSEYGIAYVYRCIEAVTEPEEFDPYKWEFVREANPKRELIFLGTPESIAYDAFQGCDDVVSIVYVPWDENEVDGAPWGLDNAIIVYNYIPS